MKKIKREKGKKMKKNELGTIVAEFPPNMEEKNCRNSEGAFFPLPDKRILFVYSRFGGEGWEDWACSDIGFAISKDQGRTFEKKGILMTCKEEKAKNIMSLSLIPMENGDIGLFYLVRTTYTMMQMYLRRSGDGGETWSERVLCTPEEGFFVVNNDRVVRLASGRILIPAAVHRTGKTGDKEKEASRPSENTPDGNLYMDSRSEVMFFYSDDDGRSWMVSEGKCSMPHLANCRSGLQEPGVLEIRPGILWGFARTDLGRQYEMYSMDNGNTWTSAQPSRFTSPNSPLSMKRNWDGIIYAVWNPVPEYNGREKKTEIFTGGRTPYVIAMSRDNGKTFSREVAFETEEDHGYCYCAMCFLEDGILLGYNAGGPKEKSCLTKLRIRRISYEQLEDAVTGN